MLVHFALVCIGSYALGQTKTMVRVSPSSRIVQPSSVVSFDVNVDNVENLFAASTKLAFDSNILRYNSVTGGSFLAKDNTNFVFLGVVSHPPPPLAPNTITIDQAIFGGAAVSGSGILFTILFKALRKGSSPIMLDSIKFRNGLNKIILTKAVSGKVTVNNVPEAARLLTPAHGSIIDATLCVMLVWSKSIDSDIDDDIRYNVHVMSALTNLSVCDLSDTTLTLTKDKLKENTMFTWYVDATDGFDTVASKQRFNFKTPLVQYPAESPNIFGVEQNYPNPFHQVTMIRFSVPQATHIDVKVYDLTGREIIQLRSDDVDAGYYMTTWDGKNSKGIPVGSGVYLYKVLAGAYSEVKKMVLLK
jgi:hypothetical protein